MATQQQLIEARDALHKLRTGRQAVRVQKDGRLVEYAPADRKDLEKYVQQLEQELSGGRGRRPAGVIA
ncbi:phage tail protein [Pokkaliibacter plantistimulans]|uniref:Phage tail protein n=1 Tax=Proteobacteria bacterium 228 TaxID=2083153 RepID=A0A2S5KTS4_9PROT|nr:gpW family head-tail joining protein [Pokkaliibacter plantistimulans]PPC77929.1 phage tail protein [Pokkaliibacter plantistimulans]